MGRFLFYKKAAFLIKQNVSQEYDPGFSKEQNEVCQKAGMEEIMKKKMMAVMMVLAMASVSMMGCGTGASGDAAASAKTA